MVAVQVAAPLVLRIFGPAYVANGTTALRLLILVGPAVRDQGPLRGDPPRAGPPGPCGQGNGGRHLRRSGRRGVGWNLWGMTGLCVGWATGASCEAVVLLPAVVRFPPGPPSNPIPVGDPREIHDLPRVGPMPLAGRPDHHVACNRLSPSCQGVLGRWRVLSRLTTGGTASRGASEVVAHASAKLPRSATRPEMTSLCSDAERGRWSNARPVRSSGRAPDERRIVLIFGCQRSGTTMLQQTFLDRSWRVRILEEHDRRLVRPGRE